MYESCGALLFPPIKYVFEQYRSLYLYYTQYNNIWLKYVNLR
nr:MAG TPA: hypothetical protein [Caudoviricetes sp.]